MAPTSFDNRFFAAVYNRASGSRAFRSMFDDARYKLTQAAHGAVLEVGAGGGQNFGFYDPQVTTSVEAVEPNAHMRRVAEQAAQKARVPIHVHAAPAEALPFADASFDSVLATLVFCSVRDPDLGMRELSRVLKPGGALLLFEHVRNPTSKGWVTVQNAFTPIQQRFAGNCHLNRDTGAVARAAGFVITTEEWSGGGIHPTVLLIGTKPA